jgi:hypothetical protein
LITIFKTGEFDYKDIGIDKPVKYTMDNLMEVASRTSRIKVTKEHSNDIISEMSNFIIKDGMLMAEEPNNLELKGMGFSPVFNFDLIDKGDYYEPTNIVMTEIGYTKNPRTRIVYNSIQVPNGESSMSDSELQKLVKRNNELQEEIGVLKKQQSQFNKRIKEKDKEIKEIKEQYADSEEKAKEYDNLKKIEQSYNQLISSKRDDLIHQIVGKDKKKAEKFKDYSIEQLETTLDLLKGKQSGKGITPKTNRTDDGNDVDLSEENENEEVYTDEDFEADFKASGL